MIGRMGRTFCRIFRASLFLATSAQVVMAAPSIQWQVANPFRFYKYDSDFEIHRWAYSELSDQEKQTNPASAMERKLNDPQWWNKTGADGKTHLEMLKALRQAEGRSFTELEPRLGWASLLRRITNDTCWNASTQLYRDCESSTINVSPRSSYFDPAAHRVTAWVSNGNASATCHWTADSPVFVDPKQPRGTTLQFSAPCDARVSLLIPNEHPVQVTAAGDPSGDTSEKLLVDNLIIVGLGDSMASGEGNPDVPVKLDPDTGIAPAYDEKELLQNKPTFDWRLGVPRREDLTKPALWIDRRCHRSIYSWQTRVALGIALREPQHRSVTFISFSCSGAEVLPGLLYPWQGREKIAPSTLTRDGRGRLNRPQVDAIIDELCRDHAAPPNDYLFNVSLDPNDAYVKSNHIPRDRVKLRSCPQDRMRPIDLLLIDIGVNDVGFGSLALNMMLTNGTSHYPGQVSYTAKFLRKAMNVIDFDTAKRKLTQLKLRFEALHSVIKNRLKLRDDDESRVLFASYPPLVSANANGGLCPTGRATMTLSEIFEVKTDDVIRQAGDFTEHNMLSTLLQYAAPWTYVQEHHSKFFGHGYCAFSADGPDESRTGTAEIRSMPYMRFTSGPGFNQWQFYNPGLALFPYESRTRWFRTFNDDYMIINYSKTAVVPPGEPAQVNNPIELAEAAASGPLHPTAEGHAHIANAVIQAAMARLKLSASSDQAP